MHVAFIIYAESIHSFPLLGRRNAKRAKEASLCLSRPLHVGSGGSHGSCSLKCGTSRDVPTRKKDGDDGDEGRKETDKTSAPKETAAAEKRRN